jgi:hypothetical protein
MPMTPRATARIVDPAIRTKVSPCADASRRANRCSASTIAGAGGNRKPAITTAIRNLIAPVPASAAIASRLLPTGLSCGAIRASAA